ncbi:hypothetical protein K8O68_08120 [Salipaludibacillus sp. CUR1]|uniref:hypothetical protein n=1 Tax=Salipaludibacillus sp. CUR1 TaxID=2820003 RepID=UPI001E6001DA|nr:hypothetical protein [Salipaludibacillus sp. CUR1]MCE7792382.1 hypothetical protein [Salipaludibacillus sp. CUR1]
MDGFEVIKKFKSEEELTVNQIKEEIKSSLGKSLKYDVVSDQGNSLEVKGVEKGAPYKFNATFDIQINGNKAKVTGTGKQKLTGGYIFALAIAFAFSWLLLPLIGLIFGLVRMNSNKNMYTKKLDDILNNVETQLTW